MELYFAYGSNLSVEQMRARCPNSRLVDVAKLFRYRLSFNYLSRRWQGGAANIQKATNGVVWGLVYALSRSDLELLDSFEGVPYHYKRISIEVQFRDGSSQKVWSYCVSNPVPFVAPTKEYLENIRLAAQLFEFPEWYQQMLRTVPVNSLHELESIDTQHSQGN